MNSQQKQQAVDKMFLTRILTSALAAGGLTGLLRGYISYVNSSSDEDSSLSESINVLNIPLQEKAQKVKRNKNKLDPEMFMQPHEETANVTDMSDEPAAASQSSDSFNSGWGDENQKTASSGTTMVSYGNPSLPIALTALPLAVMAFQGGDFASSKILALAKKREIKRQLAEAEAAYLRALEAENQQTRPKMATVNTWDPGSAAALALLGAPGLVYWLSGQTTDRILSQAFPPLKRELPETNRIERIVLPPEEVLEEDGTPAQTLVIKTANFLKVADAEEFMYRVAMELPEQSSACLRDLVKCASAGGITMMEEALAANPEAMWKLASNFRGMTLEPVERTMGLSLISRSSVAPVAMMHAAAMLHDFSPTMHKSARKLQALDPMLPYMAEGAGACLGVMSRAADMKGHFDIPLTPIETLQKVASRVDRQGEIDMIQAFLAEL